MIAQLDLRDYIRFQPLNWGTEANLSNGPKAIRGRVIDEGFGGLGVRTTKKSPFEIGEIIQVDNGRIARCATVIYIHKLKRGQRLGLEWVVDPASVLVPILR